VENLGLIVLALPDGTLVKKEVLHPASEVGLVVFFEDIVATVPECRAAAYRNADGAIKKWKRDHPGLYSTQASSS
jgi:hypothetical protein